MRGLGSGVHPSVEGGVNMAKHKDSKRGAVAKARTIDLVKARQRKKFAGSSK